MKMENTKKKELVLITGGSGFIGQALAKKLSSRFQVIALDLRPPKNEMAGIDFVKMDIS